MIIGKIKLPDGGEAALDSNGKWHCDDDLLEEDLNINANPAKATGSGLVLPYGYWAVMKAAEITGGQVTHAPKVQPLEEGELS